MEIGKNFDHAAAEQRWYQHWEQRGYFHSVPDDRAAYTITMPPPNVTGVLHMGHALNNSVQDILIRRAKAQGYNTCWVPGTDHASIATEAKVVAMLREKGIDKNALSREEFLSYAWEWKEKYGGIILEQLKRLGCALDWERTAFTMDEEYYRAVIRVFVDLYRKGRIYRGVKMINWDPKAKTALSDEEVIHKATQSKLCYVQYALCDQQGTPTEGHITIATVRPETILGDTAVCVHPDDPRYAQLKGQYCLVPLINRPIPIIFDDYIDLEFGTGALKVTPAHDINDYNLGLKHKLAVIDTLNEDGTLSAAAGLYVGQDRFEVRRKIVEDLKASGNFVKEEPYTNQVGYSERTDAVIEPRLSMQWWCKMEDLAKPALEVVMNDKIQFHPEKFKNTYRHWMENIRDWCVSRQLRWGQRIPAWYDAEGNMYIGETEKEAYEQFKASEAYQKKPATVLQQDNDCLDTWFSSWLWPMQVFGWNEQPNNADLSYYYPTQTLVTAPEIIFFWVARMVMAGEEYLSDIPFEKVYFTGIVRDKQGRKMSKSLGNSPDLLALIDEWGTDAVRFSVIIASPAGNDLLYDESMLLQGRNFCNKLWNAMKLLKMWEERATSDTPKVDEQFAVQWINARIDQSSETINKLFESFQLSEALKSLYSLIWDDFCSWYLEWVKPAPGNAISKHTYDQSIAAFERLLQLLHPFLPFVTEEIYHLIASRESGDDLMILPLSPATSPNESLLADGTKLQQIITAIRDARAKAGLKPKDPIEIWVNASEAKLYQERQDTILRQTNAQALHGTKDALEGAISLVLHNDKIYLKGQQEVDTAVQKEALRKELEYLNGFLKSVEQKLNNEKFVNNAKPEVVNLERKKQSDTLSRIQTIAESLALL